MENIILNKQLVERLERDKQPVGEVLSYLMCLHYGYSGLFISQNVRDYVKYNRLAERDANSVKVNVSIFMAEKDEDIVTIGKTTKKLVKTGFKDFITKWINKFPTQSETGLSYSISGNTKACTERMNRFITQFNGLFGVSYHISTIYDVINKATDKYIESQKSRNWSYTKKNSKFIYDNDSSYLEDFCKIVINGETTPNYDNENLLGGGLA